MTGRLVCWLTQRHQEKQPVTTPLDISVVIPVLNEVGSLPQLYDELTSVLGTLDRSYEIMIIDDGSSDGSVACSRELVERDSHVVLVELRRRFGKAAALQVGFNQVRGNIVITMDADLQDDPHEIPRFLEKLDEGFDLVSGWKENRKDPIGKTLPSKLFNWATSKASGLKLQDFNCGFKAYRREVVEGLELYGELYRYIPVIVHSQGYRVGELAVCHRARKHGESKYGLERFMRGPFDLFTILFLCGFRRRPLHLFGPVGVGVAALGFLIDFYLAILWLGGQVIGDRPLLMLGTLLIVVGVQILIFGLLGEMIVAASYRATEVNDSIRSVARRVDEQSKPRRVV